MKILVATEKPFAKKAVDGIRKIVEDAGYELALLEKYTDKGQLLAAVADVDALIVRSDKVTAEVIAAAKNLKIVVRAGAGYDNVDLAAGFGAGHRGDEHPGSELQCRGRTGAGHDDLHGAQPLHAGYGYGTPGQDARHPRLRQRRQAGRPQGQGVGHECRRLRSVHRRRRRSSRPTA